MGPDAPAPAPTTIPEQVALNTAAIKALQTQILAIVDLLTQPPPLLGPPEGPDPRLGMLRAQLQSIKV